MPYSANKENRQPSHHPSFATKAAKAAVSRNTIPKHIQPQSQSTQTQSQTQTESQSHQQAKTLPPTQIDKVVESVANATKRLSQQSSQSNSSKRKVENRVGPWRLGRTLGKGSTGRVRLAKHTITGKLAAIKIVPKIILNEDTNNINGNGNGNGNGNKGRKKRKPKVDENGLPYGIEREIIIMKLISHPNIMALYDVWENKNELYLVLEYVEGGELFDFLINNGRLNEHDAVKYFRMIISGVSYCHKFNICHRDLKPENILLDKNGRIKIADFGMAALETQHKLLETSCGSPHYASPEIVAGKNYHGSPSDVWSCGVILFALLTGHLPFDDPNIRKLLMKVQTGKFHMPSNLSAEAKDLIWSMLRTDPSERIKIEDVFNHPLMTKYPDDTIDEVENKLDHLDVSKPIISIDPDILNNLQTLWHGIPYSHIVEKLKNTDKNPEKMFYYLLEIYKLTHADDQDLPNLKHSISKTTLRVREAVPKATTPNTNLPRSTSTVVTTILDKDGKVLKKQVQELKNVKSPLKTKTSSNSLRIVASTSYNKSISFQKIRRDTSASTLSIVNMSRNLSILPDHSTTNLKGLRSGQSSSNYTSPASVMVKSSGTPNSYTDAHHITTGSSSTSNTHGKMPNSGSFTVNPKDLPDLPDLQDYKYLMSSIFDTDDPKAARKSYKTEEEKKRTTRHSKVEDGMVILDVADHSLSLEETPANTTTTTTSTVNSCRTSSLDPKSSSFLENIEETPEFSKLDLLRRELGISGSPSSQVDNVRNFSGLKSIKSSSTRRLNTFLQDEYKNVRVGDYNSKHKVRPTSATPSHKADTSFDSSVSYSLHSAVEVRMMSPTEEELRKMSNDENKANDGKFKLIPNINQDVNSQYLTNDKQKTHHNNPQVTLLNGIPNALQNGDTSSPDFAPPTTSYRQSQALSQPSNDDTFDSEITGSLYTTLEEQPPFQESSKAVLASPMKNVKKTENPFTNDVNDIRMSMLLQTNERRKVPNLQRKEPTHPYRLKPPTTNTNTVVDCTAASNENGSTSHVKQHTAAIGRPQSTVKDNGKKKSSNWFKKFVESFVKNSDTSTSSSNVASNSGKLNMERFKGSLFGKKRAHPRHKFSFGFNKAKYTPSQNRNIFSTPEVNLESDTVTRGTLLDALQQHPKAQMLNLVASATNPLVDNGYVYTFEVKNLKTKIQVEVFDKLGSEFGFGGCFVKILKINGSRSSFEYWCQIITEILAELENENELIDV